MNIWTKLAEFSFFETDRLYLRPFFFSDSQDFHTCELFYEISIRCMGYL